MLERDWRTQMNLDTVHAILLATTEQPYGFLKIANPKLEPTVREMLEAGLITATLSDGKPGSFTAVNSVTNAGLRFLRVFRRHDFSRSTAAINSAHRTVIPFVRPRDQRAAG
jgi:hypothetical protein